MATIPEHQPARKRGKGKRTLRLIDAAQSILEEIQPATVRGTLGPVLDKFGVTFRVMHGYASATAVNEIAETSVASDKPLIALYVGDWDPSGKHMSDVDLPRRLREYGADLAMRRIALERMHMVGLPSFDPESKSSDPRYRWFREHVGTDCYELDALPPPELRACVEGTILGLIDRKAWDHACMVEAVEVASMQDFDRSWQASISGRPVP
jgi:hypothetical protein